jgi:hypothetical protein
MLGIDTREATLLNRMNVTLDTYYADVNAISSNLSGAEWSELLNKIMTQTTGKEFGWTGGMATEKQLGQLIKNKLIWAGEDIKAEAQVLFERVTPTYTTTVVERNLGKDVEELFTSQSGKEIEDCIRHADRIEQGFLRSLDERIQLEGGVSMQSGASSLAEDMRKGGADSVFLRVQPRITGGSNQELSRMAVFDEEPAIRYHFDKSILNRTDWYANMTDKYGAIEDIKAKNKGKAYFKRFHAPDAEITNNEIMFRKGVDLKYCTYIEIDDGIYESIVSTLEKRGMTQVNGVPIRKFIKKGCTSEYGKAKTLQPFIEKPILVPKPLTHTFVSSAEKMTAEFNSHKPITTKVLNPKDPYKHKLVTIQVDTPTVWTEGQTDSKGNTIWTKQVVQKFLPTEIEAQTATAVSDLHTDLSFFGHRVPNAGYLGEVSGEHGFGIVQDMVDPMYRMLPKVMEEEAGSLAFAKAGGFIPDKSIAETMITYIKSDRSGNEAILLDYLTGQADRTAANIAVSTTANGQISSAILLDNGLAFQSTNVGLKGYWRSIVKKDVKIVLHTDVKNNVIHFLTKLGWNDSAMVDWELIQANSERYLSKYKLADYKGFGHRLRELVDNDFSITLTPQGKIVQKLEFSAEQKLTMKRAQAKLLQAKADLAAAKKAAEGAIMPAELDVAAAAKEKIHAAAIDMKWGAPIKYPQIVLSAEDKAIMELNKLKVKAAFEAQAMELHELQAVQKAAKVAKAAEAAEAQNAADLLKVKAEENAAAKAAAKAFNAKDEAVAAEKALMEKEKGKILEVGKMNIAPIARPAIVENVNALKGANTGVVHFHGQFDGGAVEGMQVQGMGNTTWFKFTSQAGDDVRKALEDKYVATHNVLTAKDFVVEGKSVVGKLRVSSIDMSGLVRPDPQHYISRFEYTLKSGRKVSGEWQLSVAQSDKASFNRMQLKLDSYLKSDVVKRANTVSELSGAEWSEVTDMLIRDVGGKELTLAQYSGEVVNKAALDKMLKSKLQWAGVDEKLISEAKFEQVSASYTTVVVPREFEGVADIWSSIAGDPYFGKGVSAIKVEDFLAKIEQGCLRSLDDRLLTQGGESFVSANSLKMDMGTGGAASVFARIQPVGMKGVRTAFFDEKCSFRFHYDKSLLNRTDWYGSFADNYGATKDIGLYGRGEAYTKALAERFAKVGKALTENNEVMFRTAIDLKYCTMIEVDSTVYADVIAGLEKRGITTFNGKPIREFFQDGITKTYAMTAEEKAAAKLIKKAESLAVKVEQEKLAEIAKKQAQFMQAQQEKWILEQAKVLEEKAVAAAKAILGEAVPYDAAAMIKEKAAVIKAKGIPDISDLKPSVEFVKEYQKLDLIAHDYSEIGGSMNKVSWVKVGNKRYIQKIGYMPEFYGDIPMESAYYDMSVKLGMRDLVPKTGFLSTGHTIQEFVPQKTMRQVIGEIAEVDKPKAIEAMNNFLKSQQGNEAQALDYIMGQCDRHSGNFMIDYENGVFKNMRLIDNGMALADSHGDWRMAYLGIDAQEVQINALTKMHVKDFMTKMGWVGEDTDWKTVTDNLADHFFKYRPAGKIPTIYGVQGGVDQLAKRLRVLASRDFVILKEDWESAKFLKNYNDIANAEDLAKVMRKQIAAENAVKQLAKEAADKLAVDELLKAEQIAKESVALQEKKFVTDSKFEPIPRPSIKIADDYAIAYKEGKVSYPDELLPSGMNKTTVTKIGGQKYVDKVSKNINSGDAAMESGYYDFSKVLDLDLVPETGYLGNGHSVQKFTQGKQYFDFDMGYAAREEAFLNLLKTDEGRDWISMDFLMGQTDRHGGNFLVSLAEDGKTFKNLRLIDNGMSLSMWVNRGFPILPPNQVMAVKMTEKTTAALKKFMNKMGWVEGGETNWAVVDENLVKHFGQYGGEDFGTKQGVARMTQRLELLEYREFEILPGDWIDESFVPALKEARAAKLSIQTAAKNVEKALAQELKAAAKKVVSEVVAPAKVVPLTSVEFAQAFKKADKVYPKVENLAQGINKVKIVEADGVKMIEKTCPALRGDVQLESLSYDLSNEWGMTGLVPKTGYVGKGVSIQEFNFGKTYKNSIAQYSMTEPERYEQLKAFVDTEQGKQWQVFDYIMGQTDRHGSNFMIDYDGKVFSNLTLMDNGMSVLDTYRTEGLSRITFFDKDAPGGLLSLVTDDLAIEGGVKDSLKTFMKKFGWVDDVDAATDWQKFGGNFQKYIDGFMKNAPDPLYGSEGGVAKMRDRLRLIASRDFKILKGDWTDMDWNDAIAKLKTETEKLQKADPSIIKTLVTKEDVVAKEAAAVQEAAALSHQAIIDAEVKAAIAQKEAEALEAARLVQEKAIKKAKAAAKKQAKIEAEALAAKKLAEEQAAAGIRPTAAEFAKAFKKADKVYPDVGKIEHGINKVKIVEVDGVKMIEKKAYEMSGDCAMEAFAYDLSNSLGMGDIVPTTGYLGKGRSIQTFVSGKKTFDNVMAPFSDLGVNEKAAALRDFVYNTDQGNKWSIFDYLMGQTDRHGGNFMIDFDGTKFSNLTLMDNGMSLCGTYRTADVQRAIAGNFGEKMVNEKIIVNAVTKENLKTFMKKFGWVDDVDAATDWVKFDKNIIDLVAEYQDIPGAVYGSEMAAGQLATRLRVLAHRDFVIEATDWTNEGFDKTIAKLNKATLEAQKANPEFLKTKEVAVKDLLPPMPKVVGVPAEPKVEAKAKPKAKPKAKAKPEAKVAGGPVEIGGNAAQKFAADFEALPKKKKIDVFDNADAHMNKVEFVQAGDKKFVVKQGDFSNGDIFTEAVYSDMDKELGMGLVPDVGFLGGDTGGSKVFSVQEFVKGGKTFNQQVIQASGKDIKGALTIDESAGVALYNKNIMKAEKAMAKFLKTEQGKNWQILDWIMGQKDRHGANLMIDYVEGEFSNLKLIDNGMCLTEAGGADFLNGVAGVGYPKNLVIEGVVKDKLQTFMSKLGWVEGGPNNWDSITKNLQGYFKQFRGKDVFEEFNHGGALGVDKMVQKLRLLEEQDFVIKLEDWDTDRMNEKLFKIQNKEEFMKKKVGVK